MMYNNACYDETREDIMGMNYLTAKETGEKWGLTSRRVAYLCEEGRVAGAMKKANVWLIPHDTAKPSDGRVNNRRQLKKEHT